MKQTRLSFSKHSIFAILCLGLISLPVGVWAIPSASFLYTETNIAAEVWQYDYILYNTSDMLSDAGYDIFDVFLSVDPTKIGAILALPNGWDGASGAGFIQATSQNPGSPPSGADIAPGSSLIGFSFLFDYQAGNIPFVATFSNPNDVENPYLYNGITVSAPAAVPEPATLLLFCSGLFGIRSLKRRIFRQNHYFLATKS